MLPTTLDIADAPLEPDERWPAALPPRLAAFCDYLDRCRPPEGPVGGTARFPVARLAAFDMLHIPELIAHLILLDPVNVGGRVRFRFRFVGTWHLATFGYDPTGTHIDELQNDPLAGRSQQALEAILDTGEPHYWRRPSVFERQKFLYYQRIMAPLADETGRIVRLVGCFDAAED